VLAVAFAMYFKESKGIQQKIKARRMAIEFELPRLVEKTLSHSRDVLAILDTYRENAGAELKYELSITVADMRSGNYESALTSLKAVLAVLCSPMWCVDLSAYCVAITLLSIGLRYRLNLQIFKDNNSNYWLRKCHLK
jgi:hypothetical protein